MTSYITQQKGQHFLKNQIDMSIKERVSFLFKATLPTNVNKMNFKYVHPLTVFLLLSCKETSSLRCYQCVSSRDKGCWKYNLNSTHLQDCPTSSGMPNPVCRVLSQIHYFTTSQDVTQIRECAHIYELPLRCTQSKFSSLHYSLSCECDEDGCNKASNSHITVAVIVLCGIIKSMVKFIV